MRLFSVACLTVSLTTSLLSLFAAALLLCSTAVVKAQDDAPPADATPGQGATAREPVEVVYDKMPVNEQKRPDISKIGRMSLQKKFATDAERELFDAYYKEYALSRWSVQQNKELLIKPDEEKVGVATGFRRDLRNQLASAKGGPVYDRLNDLAIEVLGAIVTGNYHPACRFNAMLAIGDLNVAQPGASESPKPLPKALPLLLAALKDPKQIDAVKVAALVGVSRHVKLGAITENQDRAAILAEVQKLAAVTPSPKTRTREGHAWMQAQAAEILGRLGSPGTKGEIVDMLSALVADARVPLSTRREAARALGYIKYDDASRASAAKAADALVQLVMAVYRDEESKDLSRRRFKDRMAAISFGLNGYEFSTRNPPEGLGLSGGATDDAGKGKLAVLQPAVLAIMETLDDPKIKDSTVLTEVGKPVANVRKLLSKEKDTKAAATESP